MKHPAPVKYSVPPFSGSKYRENSDRGGMGTLPCAICGKPVTTEGHLVWAIVVDGGAAWGDESSDPTDSGYMGGWPIGSDCHRKYSL